MPVLRLAPVPPPSEIDISEEGGSVKGADDEDEWNNFEPEVEQNATNENAAEDYEEMFEFLPAEPDEVNDLCDEKDDDASFGSVARSENKIGEASDKKCDVEEVVSRINSQGVDETQNDAAEFDDGEEVIILDREPENNDENIDDDPDGGPSAMARLAEESFE